MSITADELESALQKMSENILLMVDLFYRETGLHVEKVDLFMDQFGNRGCDCKLEIIGGAVGIKKGKMDS